MGDVPVELFDLICVFANIVWLKKKIKVGLQISMRWCVDLRPRI